jgi:hypothetical protein
LIIRFSADSPSSGTGLYRTLNAILQIHLAGHQDGVSIGIIWQNDSRTAIIIDFPRALLPATVTPSLLERDAHHLALIPSERLDILYTYTRAISLHGNSPPVAPLRSVPAALARALNILRFHKQGLSQKVAQLSAHRAGSLSSGSIHQHIRIVYAMLKVSREALLR